MNILFSLGHPAHYHLFKETMKVLRGEGHSLRVLIRKKDVLADLLDSDGVEYTNILPSGRGKGKVAMAWGLLRKEVAVYEAAREFRPAVMAGTSVEITHAGRLLGIPSIVVNEDDAEAVPLFAKMAYPFASAIVAPGVCSAGKWEHKRIAYEGYHELAYLHPRFFTPDRAVVDRINPGAGRYFILRFAELAAHHDAGKRGISPSLAAEIIGILEPHGRVFISSERRLEPEFEKYRIGIRPSDMHHALAFADIYIGDSQTMAAEAAVLGTPSLRFNDFAGRLGYLEELEQAYGLTFGIRTAEPEKLLGKIRDFLSTPGIRAVWQERRAKMLSRKINVTAFLAWFIGHYPESDGIVKKDPSFPETFR